MNSSSAFVAVLEETVAEWSAGRVSCTVVLPIARLSDFNAAVGLPPLREDRGRPDAEVRLVLVPSDGPSDPASEVELAIAATADALAALLAIRTPIRPAIRERLVRVSAAAIEATLDPERALIRTEPA